MVPKLGSMWRSKAKIHIFDPSTFPHECLGELPVDTRFLVLETQVGEFFQVRVLAFHNESVTEGLIASAWWHSFKGYSLLESVDV